MSTVNLGPKPQPEPKSPNVVQKILYGIIIAGVCLVVVVNLFSPMMQDSNASDATWSVKSTTPTMQSYDNGVTYAKNTIAAHAARADACDLSTTLCRQVVGYLFENIERENIAPLCVNEADVAACEGGALATVRQHGVELLATVN